VQLDPSPTPTLEVLATSACPTAARRYSNPPTINYLLRPGWTLLISSSSSSLLYFYLLLDCTSVNQYRIVHRLFYALFGAGTSVTPTVTSPYRHAAPHWVHPSPNSLDQTTLRRPHGDRFHNAAGTGRASESILCEYPAAAITTPVSPKTACSDPALSYPATIPHAITAQLSNFTLHHPRKQHFTHSSKDLCTLQEAFVCAGCVAPDRVSLQGASDEAKR
jgi:hypothetical protein